MARYSTVRLALFSDFHFHNFLASRAFDFHFRIASNNKQLPIAERAPNLFHALRTPLTSKTYQCHLV
jgi:hypothetical protein